MKRPFVWFLVSLIAGTVAGRYIECTFLNMFLFFILFAAIASVFLVKLKIYEPMYMPLIAVIGMLICSNSLAPKSISAQLMVNKDVMLSGTVRTSYVTDSGKTAYTVDVDLITDYENRCTDKLKIIVYSNSEDISSGDIIRAEGKLFSFDEPTNPYQPNYKIYMLSNGYDYSMWCENVIPTGQKSNGFVYNIEKARNRVNDFFNNSMPEREAGIAKALTTGYKNDITQETRENFKRLGISHVLAVSGLHVSIIAYIILYICTEVLKLQKRKAIPIASAVIVFYLVFTGFSPSAVRAVIMSVVSFTGLLIYRNSDRINTAAFSAFIMLCINPLYLWNVSFQLSYVGIASVIAAMEILDDDEKNKGRGKLEKTFIFSTVVWVVISPVVMYYYKGISLVAIASNIVFIPVISIVTCIAMAAGLLSLAGFGLAHILANIVYFILNIYNNVTEKFSGNVFTYMDISRPSLIAIACVYVFIFAMLLLKKKKKTKMFVIAVFAGYIAVAAVSFINSPAEIVFFDAGQGDASAIYIPRRLTAVIDGGPDGGAENSVIPYLEAKGEKVDLLFVTHMDSDHVTGAMELIKKDLVMRAVISDTVHENKDNLKKFLLVAAAYDVPVIYADKGDRFNIGEDCYFECLYPDDRTTGSENDASLVLRFIYDDTAFLFTGDIDADAEKSLLDDNINCDVIKIAHHGSKTSSSEEFISKTGAKTAVIQTAKDNIYGFPSNQVSDVLKKLDVDTYVTGNDGAVVMYDNGDNIKIKTYGK